MFVVEEMVYISNVPVWLKSQRYFKSLIRRFEDNTTEIGENETSVFVAESSVFFLVIFNFKILSFFAG